LNQIVSILDSYAYRPMVGGVYVERVSKPLSGASTNQITVVESVAAAATCLSALAAIVEFKPFLVTPQLTLADLHALPILRYLTLAPEGRELIASFRALER